MGSLVAELMKHPPAKEEDAEDVSAIPESGKSPGKGNGNLLQYSRLENSLDRRAWQAVLHGVAKEFALTEPTCTLNAGEKWT